MGSANKSSFMNKTKIIFIAIFAGSIVTIALWNLNADRLQKDSAALRDYGANEKESDISKVCFNESSYRSLSTEDCDEKTRSSLQSLPAGQAGSAERLQRGESEEVSKKCFNVELADTPEKHTQGLMNRESLNQNSGMLFLFDTEDKYSFWMKNTLIPLDIIWLDKNKEVVFIEHSAQPCEADPCETFGSGKSAKYILEINSGLAKEIGLKERDYLEFR